MSQKIKKISVIIPCYNEVNNISQCFESCVNYLVENNFKFQIIFINDGSPDDTLDQIKKVTDGNPLCHVVSYKKNLGKGYAVHRGLAIAQYRTKLILDCDMSVHINQLYKFNWVWVVKTPLIIGERIQIEKQPPHRILAGKCFKILTWLFTGFYFDTQCPFKIINIPYERINDLFINGFAYDVELISKVKSIGKPYARVFVGYHNDQESSVTLIKTIKMFFELIKIKKKYF